VSSRKIRPGDSLSQATAPERPKPLPVRDENVPKELKARPQWVGWQYEYDANRQSWLKPPYNPTTQQRANPRDPATWTSFGEAYAAAAEYGWDGIGFVFSADDSYAGIDLDDCRDPQTGQLQSWAVAIVQRLDSYTEVSPSGSGVKIFLQGVLPSGRQRRDNIELYDRQRYFTVTGQHLPGTPTTLQARQDALKALYDEIFQPAVLMGPAGTEAAPQRLDDQTILRRARIAQNREKFKRLWAGDTTGYASDSEADIALCALLAYRGARDPDQLDRLFRQSKLYRPKWDERRGADGATYGELTVKRALAWVASRTAAPRTGTTQSPVSDAEALAQARARVSELGALAKADPGAPFAPEVLGALALLQRRDPQAWARTRAELKKAGVPMRELTDALRRSPLRPTLRLVQPGEVPAPRRVADDLPDAPVADLLLPTGYVLTPTATRYVPAADSLTTTGEAVRDRRLVARVPLLITGRLHYREEQVEAVRCSWQRADGWHHRIVDRGVALNVHAVVKLASYGVPVASDTAHDVVRYLHAFEAENYHLLPQLQISSHLGWQGPQGRRGFLWGRTLIRRAGRLTVAADLGNLAPEQWAKGLVAFRGLTAGDEQVADAYHAAGTLEGWTGAVRVLRRYPRALLALYAAFLPPLLTILGVPNFVIDWANRTSTGKTTLLRVAASAWGKPDERAADGALWTWDLTRVWAERASAVLTGLPLILDDTKRAKDPRLVATLLYEVTSGRGRGRGNRTTIEPTRTWHTVLLSTGEAPATSFTQDGGTRTRCVEVRGMPFGEATPETRRVVERLTRRLQRHYGHAGPAFVEWLLQHRGNWKAWRREYRQRVEAYAAQATSAEAGRLAQYVAAVDVAARLVHEALRLPWAYTTPFKSLWDAIAAEAAEASGEERALRDVVSWAYAHQAQFYGRFPLDGLTPPKGLPTGTAGRWDSGPNWKVLAMFPHLLQQVLREFHYEPEAILSGWRQRGWLDVDRDRSRYTKKMRIGSAQPRVVIIRRTAIDAVEA
jgi:putative DNA primase/helicase